MDPSEAKRERTTLLYYDVHSLKRLEDVPSSAPSSNAVNCATSSRDAALIAFAELGALRLKTRRALISLFDSEYQYVVAEGTATQPLRSNSGYEPAPGDQLWLSGTAIKRGCGVCDHVILDEGRKHQQAADADSSAGEEIPPNMPAHSPERSGVSVIPDLALDARYSHRNFVRGYPHNRFYAGAPIVTRNGLKIGVLCVFDDAPRKGLSGAEIELMQDLAQMIMQHLDANRSRASARRHERMVRGIGSLVEGSSTISGWSENQDTSSYQGATGDEGLLDARQQAIEMQTRDEDDPGLKVAATDAVAEKTSIVTPSIEDGPTNAHELAIQTIFAKAANIIRESLEVEGVLFFDAQVQSFGGMVGGDRLESSDSDSTSVSSSNLYLTEESDQPCKLLAFSNSDSSSVNDPLRSGIYTLKESSLKLLFRRYPEGKTYNFDALGIAHSSDSEGTDRGTKASDNAEHVSSLSTHKPRRRRRKQSRVNEATEILKVLPGARSAMFLPMWDFDRQRWYSGCVAFTRKSHRMFSARGDLSLLSAFCTTIMSQVSRLDALAVDKAKTDLLGSISHELRSPLHGLLNGVEMLADTQIDSFQGDVLHTVETCGRTLLDTMDHLLDYSKINHFMQVKKSSRGQGKSISNRGMRSEQDSNPTIESGLMTLSADVELDILVEEVLESVFAGHRSVFASSNAESAHIESDVAVILDTESGQSNDSSAAPARWQHRTHPGAFRRVLMNVFANSLKYTKAGTIRVSLRLNGPNEASGPANEPANVTLKVSDTGQGISADYLNNHLFRPFSQEDRLVPGIGLGLSLSNSIVRDLGGSMDVRSAIGVGTDATIHCAMLKTLDTSRRTSTSSGRSVATPMFQDDLQATKGLRIAFLSFTDRKSELLSGVDAKYTPVRGGRTSPPAKSTDWHLPRQEVEAICLHRLGMEVLPAPQNVEVLSQMSTRAEILFTTETEIDQIVDELLALEASASFIVPPLIVVCGAPNED